MYMTHTTTGLTINENADTDIVRDMLAGLARFGPGDGRLPLCRGKLRSPLLAAIPLYQPG
jgi:thiamine phosphate synthase YjbQ (UPF0047 family)